MTYEDWYLNKYNIHLSSEIYYHYGTQDYNAIDNVIYINGSTIAKPEYENMASDYHRLNRTTSSEELVEKIMNVTMSGSVTKQDVIHRPASYLLKEQLMMAAR